MPGHVLNKTQYNTFFQLINFILKAKGDDRYRKSDSSDYYAQVARILKVAPGTVYNAFFRQKDGMHISDDKLSQNMFGEFEGEFKKHVLSKDLHFISQLKKAAIKTKFDQVCNVVKKSYELSNSSKEKIARKENFYNSLRSNKLTRLKDLAGLYEGNLYQGQCVDWCQLILKTNEPDQVHGLMKVRYQYDQKKPIPDALLDIQGDFSYDIVIRLLYQNVKKEIPQLGVIYLEYNSEQQLTGYFVAFYIGIPEDREKRGEIWLKKVSKEPKFPPEPVKQE